MVSEYFLNAATTLPARGLEDAISSQNPLESLTTCAHSLAGREVSSIFLPSTRSFASPPQYQTSR